MYKIEKHDLIQIDTFCYAKFSEVVFAPVLGFVAHTITFDVLDKSHKTDPICMDLHY